jgi:hypothetical protein
MPTYKKGEKSEWCTYRKISLLSIVHKILAAAVNETLVQYAEDIIENTKMD